MELNFMGDNYFDINKTINKTWVIEYHVLLYCDTKLLVRLKFLARRK